VPFMKLLLEPDDYCLEVFCDPGTKEEEVMPLVCFTDPPSKASPHILYPIGKIRHHRSRIKIPNLAVEWLAFLFCIREVSDSKLQVGDQLS
jgi:hypothetical protein